MNLHLPSDGPNLVELEIDDGALVIVRRVGSYRKVRVIAPSAGMSRIQGMLAGVVFCVLSAGAGYTMAPRAAGTDPRYEASRRLAAMPSSVPRPLTAVQPGVAVAMPTPYSDLQEPPLAQVPGSVPAAVMQHLSQRPVVTPPPAALPAAPVPPAPAAAHSSGAGNAFGLE